MATGKQKGKTRVTFVLDESTHVDAYLAAMEPRQRTAVIREAMAFYLVMQSGLAVRPWSAVRMEAHSVGEPRAKVARPFKNETGGGVAEVGESDTGNEKGSEKGRGAKGPDVGDTEVHGHQAVLESKAEAPSIPSRNRDKGGESISKSAGELGGLMGDW